MVEIYQYHMARISLNRSRTPPRSKKSNSIQVVVIGRDFPSSHGAMHPVAQFNITYAYSIVSRRRRRNRKGLCTLGSVRLRRTGRTKAGSCTAISSPTPVKVASRPTKFPPSRVAWRLRRDLPWSVATRTSGRTCDTYVSRGTRGSVDRIVSEDLTLHAIVEWNCSSLFDSVNF